jgi:hypothetical protein
MTSLSSFGPPTHPLPPCQPTPVLPIPPCQPTAAHSECSYSVVGILTHLIKRKDGQAFIFGAQPSGSLYEPEWGGRRTGVVHAFVWVPSRCIQLHRNALTALLAFARLSTRT